ncbi:long-chain fatty acid--CoA ligase [halophilic archaeon]|nr:long-chain fatty acid--CoA ligase [halophilic archaeon]
MHMGRIFQRTVERHPNRTAVVDEDEEVEYTYQEWNSRVNQLASALATNGIGPGDRVGVVMQPRVQAGTIYWALQKLGAAFAPYNIRATADDLKYLVNNTEPELLIYSSIAREAVDTAHSDFDSSLDLIYVDGNVPEYADTYDYLLEGEEYEFELMSGGETSVILHTSGTTGRPKGVPRSHRNTYAAATAHAIQSEWTDGESILGLMPIYHTMGLRTLATSAVLSGKWVAQRSFSPSQTLQLIESEGITALYLVPTVFHDLVKYDDIEEADVSTVKRLGYAGTPMTKPVQKQTREAFDPDIFINHYGSTEVYTYSICSWLDKKPGSAGRAGINTRVRVVRPEQGETVPPSDTVETGELGEIIVDATSPEAFDGYLNSPDADEKSFEDGWYFTGDIGYRDDSGDLFVTGRVDDMIISGGENIYPVEVENVLDGYEMVNEVAIVGLDDERWNQIVTAFTIVDDDPDNFNFESFANELDTYCRESEDLADFKRPRKYVFVDEIVKSNVGKVLRRELSLEDLDVQIYAEENV